MFTIKVQDQKARTCILKTQHGNLPTPFFMPVATKASVKHISSEDLTTIGTDALICNAFVLSLVPGIKTVDQLHSFMNWNKGIFTDSGGFQVLSDFFCQKLCDRGVYFKDITDGKTKLFTPEDSIAIQETIGSDVMMCLDDVPRHDADKQRIIDSIKRTHKWAERCLKTRKNKKQLLFGITQGGTNPDLRKQSTEFFAKLPFDGYSLGGLCIGESKTKMEEMIKLSAQILPEQKPKYLMGVGSPEDLLDAIEMGIDIFDSAFPTQNARHGTLFTSNGKLRILNKENRFGKEPIDSTCNCFVCKTYSRSFISHLLRNKEGTGYKLASYHNLWYMQRLVEEARTAIKEKRFGKFKKQITSKY